jgi:hypothetical protein
MNLQPGPWQTRSATVKSSTNRRSHSRLSINREVYLCWQDRQGNHVLHARTLDISKFGMLVKAESGLARGVVVSVATNAITLGCGCVRHCELIGSKYRIGVHMPDRMTTLMACVELRA